MGIFYFGGGWKGRRKRGEEGKEERGRWRF